MANRTLVSFIAVLCMSGEANAQAWVPQRLQAETIARFDAPDADQGAAVDEMRFYAIDNSIIAAYDKRSGELLSRWQGPEGPAPDDEPIAHMNSCVAHQDRLVCANSNYSETPMASSIEVFSTAPVSHHASHSLGLMDEGSVTWALPTRDGWLAGFAHYDGTDGGLAFKGHRFTGVVTFDENWRRTGGYMLPNSVLERLRPDAASGGALGPDGLLYLMGHDRPELYVLAKPSMGPKLVHLATISVEAEGQAFSWDFTTNARHIYAVDRRQGRVLVIKVPLVGLNNPHARRFEVGQN